MTRLAASLNLAFVLALPLWLADLLLAAVRGGIGEGWLLGSLASLGLLQLLCVVLSSLAVIAIPQALQLDSALLKLWSERAQKGHAGTCYAILAWGLGLALGLALALRLNTAFEGQFQTEAYTLLLRSLAVGLALGFGLLCGRRLGLALNALGGPSWLSPAHLLVALSGFGLIGYALLWWQRDLLFKEIDPWPLLAVAVIALGSMLIAVFAQRQRPRPKVWLGASLALMVVFVLGAGSAPKVAASLSGGLPLASSLASWLRPLGDLDGDGVSSWLGGGDCAPFDIMSFPGAVDFPDDGIDQDCFAGDLSSQQEGIDLEPGYAPVDDADRAELLVLVSVDALRPDFMGLYGYRTYPSSPKIDAWARGAVVFDNAFTSGPYTTIAIPSMLTGFGMGQIPGYITNLFDERISSPTVRLPGEVETIAEALKAQGYATGAIVSGFDIKINAFDQGFDQAKVITPRSLDTADKVTEEARRWLAQNPKGKRFLWLHYFDPHDPYFHDVSPKFGSSTKARYASSIAFMDLHLGDLLADLAKMPSSLVALVSDHGESLGEKGKYGHGFNLHRHEAHMVMAWRGSGLRPRRIGGAASIVDVAPTLLNAAGASSRPSAGFSLVNLLKGGLDDHRRAVLTESYRRGHHFSVSTADWRLFYHLDQNRFELYDQRLDKAEKTNLASTKPEQVERLRGELLKLMNRGGTFVRRAQVVRDLIVDQVPEQARLERPVRFGDAIELVGYSFGQGGSVDKPQHVATLYLRALRRMKTSWKVAFGLKGLKPMNKDHFPGRSYYPTNQWPPGVIIKNPVILGTMSKFPAARWSMTLGFYEGDRRLVPNPGGSMPLTKAGTRITLTDTQVIKPMRWAVERDRKKRQRQLEDKKRKKAEEKP